MEIKIGMQNVHRELTLDMDGAGEQLQQQLAAATAAGEPVTLTDKNGRTVIVAPGSIAYIEIGAEQGRRVGFGLG